MDGAVALDPAGAPVRRRLLQISSYPPPRAGWGVRVQFLKRFLDARGYDCRVLNIGSSRRVPNSEYETVDGALDYVRKVVRFTRAGYVPHLHANGKGAKGVGLAIVGALISLAAGQRPFLTFHAGVEQDYFPRGKAPAWFPAMWLLFRLPRCIICNSEAVKAKIVEYGIEPDRVVPIPAFSAQYLETTDVALPPDLAAFFARFPHVIFCYLQIRPEFNPLEVVQAFARLAAARRDVGLVLCGVSAHKDGALWERTRVAIEAPAISERLLVLDDLDHDTFLAALRRASAYLRPPATDGVASSVLEALSLRVPVIAADNGSRPAGVICYPARDVNRLVFVLDDVLDRRDEIASRLEPPPITDTLGREAALLTGDLTLEATVAPDHRLTPE